MLAYTAINVPYSALLAVISPLAVERTKATQFRFICASLGTLFVGATAKPLVTYFGGGDEVLGFRITMALFAAVSVLLFWITFLTTKERIAPTKQQGSVKDDFGVLLKNVSWVLLAISGIMVVIGLVSRISSAAFYTKYVMGADDSKVLWWMDQTTLIITCGFIGQLVGALLSPTLLSFFEKKSLMVMANVICALSMISSYFISADHFGGILALYTLGIFAFGIIITLLFAMYTDCAEYGEWVSGKNSAGLTVSASMFSLKAGSAIGSAVPAAILAWFGFNKDLGLTQSTEALEGIRLMFNLVPAVFFLIAGALMLGYQINNTLLTQIEKDLQSRRVEAVIVD